MMRLARAARAVRLGAFRAVRLGAAVTALMAAAAAGARAAQDEIVPAGVWRVQVELAARTEDTAFDTSGDEGPLLNLLVPSETVRASLSGEVVRDVRRADLLLGYGMSDTWSLVLQVPYVQIRQTSTLANTGAPDADVDAAAARLQSRDVSGLGALRVGSLHRSVFSDRHAFTYGLGVVQPLSRAASPWAGRGTLLLDVPTTRLYGNLHYTYYPIGRRDRLEVRGEAGIAFTKHLELASPTGTSGQVVPGNDIGGYVGWGRELGPLSTDVGLRLFRQARSEIDGDGQGDTASETALRLAAGFGNLNRLEQGPVAFPFQAQFVVESTVSGSSVPARVEARVGLKFYF
jgi:hypothetical protein